MGVHLSVDAGVHEVCMRGERGCRGGMGGGGARTSRARRKASRQLLIAKAFSPTFLLAGSRPSMQSGGGG